MLVKEQENIKVHCDCEERMCKATHFYAQNCEQKLRNVRICEGMCRMVVTN